MGNIDFIKLRFNFVVYFGAIFVAPAVLAAAALSKLYEALFVRRKLKSLSDEIAVVTGGAGGLGKSIAIELAKQGCHVAIVDVKGPDAEDVAKMLSQTYNIKSKAYEVDITNFEAVQRLNDKINEDLGPVTVLINNAGILIFSNPFDPDWKDVQQMINVNLTAHFWTIKVFLPKMKELKRGHIMAISSIAGLMPLVMNGEYVSTKFAVRGLMQELRVRLRVENCTGIKVTTVYPTFLQTHAQVAEVANHLDINNIYPSISGEEMAQCAVRAMLQNRREVAMPHSIPLVYRMFELLPAGWKDLIVSIVSKSFAVKYRTLNLQNQK